MRDDTHDGGRFPTTRLSVIRGAGSPDRAEVRRSLERIAAAYWKPVYKHLRLRWKKERPEAEDLTQAFFAVAIERDYLAGFDPERGRFRTFLRACVDHFVAKEHQAAAAEKRGGGARLLPLDFEGAEHELAAAGAAADPEALFEREWGRSVFELALAALREQLKGEVNLRRLRAFEAYDLAPGGERPSYAELGERLGVPATTVTNDLSFVRRALRGYVLDTLRELTADEDEFRAEARALLGGAP